MKLIVDAGSTKMGWILMEGHEVKAHFVTKGFNSNYSDRQDLENIVLARAVRYHIERRILLNGHRTVIFK